MIVCVCEAVSDREIDGTIEAGAQSIADVGAACGAGTNCGSCRFAIAARLERAAAAERRVNNCTPAMGEVASPALA